MNDQSQTKYTRIQKKASLDNALKYAESIINTVREPLIILDHDLKIITASRSFYDFFKVNPKETVGQFIYDLDNKQWDIPELRELLETILPQKTTFDNYEVEHDFAIIGRRTMLLNARQIKRTLGKERIILVAIEDITERKQAENLYKTLMEKSLVAIFIVQDGKFRFINTSAIAYADYDAEELVGRDADTIVYPEDREMVKKKGRAMLRGDHPVPYEFRMVTKQGQIRWIMQMVSPIEYKGNPAILGNAVDITERKRAEEMLKESENKYRLLADNIQDVIFVLDMNLKYTYISPSVKIMRGYEPEEILKQQSIEHTLTPSSRDLALKTFSEIMELEKSGRRDEMPLSRTLQLEMRRKDGTTVWTEVNFSFIRDENNQSVGIMGVTRDITDRKKAEDELRKSEARYRGLFEHMSEGFAYCRMIFDNGEPQDFIYLDVNNAFETLTGLHNVIGKKVSEVIPGLRETDPQLFNIYARVSLTGKSEKFEIFVEALKMWFSISVYGPEKEHFVAVFDVITERKQAEKQLYQTLDRLKKAVGTTIQVLGTASEARDPYTAGHQKRVADLARTIATEMGLPTNTIEGIRMAGSIHDIGKLSIPAEILSKPTKLTDLEFSLIKEHPRSGYEMLKDVESPWPLAQIVYQHHERMNGTGYPRNLKGDDILIEARIMAVADVVEAMASHRPYRPGLGIESALEEIEKNKGILYDNDIVEVCLRLFREKGFQLT